jgi:general stress protein 26
MLPATSCVMKNEQNKREHLIELIRDFDTAMLVTSGRDGLAARPMAFAEVRDNGDLSFSTSVESPKVSEIDDNPMVLITLQSKTKFVSLCGRASISRDRALIERLWKPDWKVWFPKGKDDPTLGLIVVDAQYAQFWDISGARGLRYIYRAAKAYLEGEKPVPEESNQVTL